MDEKQTLDYQLIPLDAIRFPEFALRRVPDQAALDELTQSIRERGVLVPIIVRENSEGYLLIAGARRVHAARAAGLVRIPACVVAPELHWEFWARLVENRLREPLNALDEAMYVAELISTQKYSQKEVAGLLGVGANWVSQRVGMLEWPPEVIEAVRSGKIGFAVARELAGISSTEHRRVSVEQAVRSGCSVRQAAEWRKASPPVPPSTPESEAVAVAGDAGGLILGSPEVCGNCGESCVGVPALLMHLCTNCLKALGKGMEPAGVAEGPSAPDD
ncbi:Nucleoid occlusion protein [subsurface metagenome]